MQAAGRDWARQGLAGENRKAFAVERLYFLSKKIPKA